MVMLVEQIAKKLILDGIKDPEAYEEFLQENPLVLIKMVYEWIEDKGMLEKEASGLPMAIMAFIAIGKELGSKLEEAFPQYKGANPKYSFCTELHVGLLSEQPEKSCNGIIDAKLEDPSGILSKDVLDILLNEVLSKSLLTSLKNILIDGEPVGLIYYCKKIDKDLLEIWVHNEAIEKAKNLYGKQLDTH